MQKKISLLGMIFLVLDVHPYNVGYCGDDAEISYETSWGKERFVSKQAYIEAFKYYKRYMEDYSFVDIAKIVVTKLPYPYCKLSPVMPFNPFGMYFNCEYVRKIFVNNDIKTALEIGSHHGVSTRHIASLLPDECRLYAVDPWEYYKGSYEQFLSNMVISGLSYKVIPIQQQTNVAINFFRQFKKTFDFIYLDGNHEAEAVVTDLENYYPLLTATGVICGDDWLIKTVREGLQQFAQKHGLTIYADCNFWFLKKEDCGYCYKSFLTAENSAWRFGNK
ncbi:class I SAM-dependent methyltransferase [Candidatus Dependentiae bacterium]|nr:class I SAM-dependent methyltransferase [Candidatus Dependentiae bacterium]